MQFAYKNRMCTVARMVGIAAAAYRAAVPAFTEFDTDGITSLLQKRSNIVSLVLNTEKIICPAGGHAVFRNLSAVDTALINTESSSIQSGTCNCFFKFKTFAKVIYRLFDITVVNTCNPQTFPAFAEHTGFKKSSLRLINLTAAMDCDIPGVTGLSFQTRTAADIERLR